MKTPLPFQKIGAQFLFNIKRGILADEMGVGKTLQAILAAIMAKEPTIVICPASIKINWAREIADQDPDAEIIIVDPGKEVYHYATGNSSKWLIINYDNLNKYKAGKLKSILGYKTMILDEGHSIKEEDRLRTKAALELAETADNIYVITGTPVLNRPKELYTLLKIVRHPIADNWYKYAYRFCGSYKREIKRWVYDHETHKRKLEIRRFLDTDGATNLDQLRRELQKVYLRRTKKQVLPNLPEKIIKTVFTDLEEPYKEKYKTAWERYINYLERIKEELIQELGSEAQYNKKINNLERSKHLVQIQKLRQITSIAKVKKVTADAFREIQLGNKVIIFVSYTYTLDQIKRILAFNKVKLVTLNGSTKNIQRQVIVDKFQEDTEMKIFIGNIKAAGVGITLTKANKVFFIDSEWTPALNEQAEDRAHRMGQEREVEVRYYVTKETIDEDVQLALDYKRGIINTILGDSDIVNFKREQSVAKEVLKRSLIRAGLSTALV